MKLEITPIYKSTITYKSSMKTTLPSQVHAATKTTDRKQRASAEI